MRGKQLTLMVAIASVGAVVATGCASAAARPQTVVNTADYKSAAAAAKVHFVGYSKNSDGTGFTVIVSGAVGDFGPAVTVYPNGKVDPDHTSELKLELRDGSFRLNIARLDRKLVSVTSRLASNPTCSFHAGVTAATPVVPGSGTRAYREISGSLTMTVTIDEVDQKPCAGGTSKFLSQLIVFVGSGRVSLGLPGSFAG
jgi:hypothetical protein